MTRDTEWLKILISAIGGFIASFVVQVVSLRLHERSDKKHLRESLYREIASIYCELRDLLTFQESKSASNNENPSEANLPEFVKAHCYEAAKTSPLFWRVHDALGVIEAHHEFQYLVVAAPRNGAVGKNEVGPGSKQHS